MIQFTPFSVEYVYRDYLVTLLLACVFFHSGVNIVVPLLYNVHVFDPDSDDPSLLNVIDTQ